MRRFQPDPSRYEIERNVGEGLNASVFKAIRVDGRERSRQHVALKFLKDRTAVEFLRREFETLSKVLSPHCARVLAWESSGEDCALVLEWVDGPTLFDLALRFQLSKVVIDEILSQIQQGLFDLRDSGLHHGDLHPRNIMIDSSGMVRLVDFATAKLANGMIQGAPSFLAPEIWNGADTSFEADLFALGVVEIGLYQGFQSLARQTQHTESGWLSLCADQRVQRVLHTERASREAARAELKHLVLQFTTNHNVVTQVLELKQRAVARFSIAASLAIAVSGFLAVAVPVQAEAPLSQNETRAEIKISTQNWAEISLNGQKVGYSPVEMSGLRPGAHRLTWKSAFGEGELRFQLKSGEKLRVLESTLRARSTPVKR
jgi:serine/threonine protein kinase